MTSLKIKTGAKHEVKSGVVELEGNCVVLREVTAKTERMVFAYCLQPGETVTKGEGDDYIVEF
jgi:hypothetical protein